MGKFGLNSLKKNWKIIAGVLVAIYIAITTWGPEALGTTPKSDLVAQFAGQTKPQLQEGACVFNSLTLAQAAQNSAPWLASANACEQFAAIPAPAEINSVGIQVEPVVEDGFEQPGIRKYTHGTRVWYYVFDPNAASAATIQSRQATNGNEYRFGFFLPIDTLLWFAFAAGAAIGLYYYILDFFVEIVRPFHTGKLQPKDTTLEIEDITGFFRFRLSLAAQDIDIFNQLNTHTSIGPEETLKGLKPKDTRLEIAVRLLTEEMKRLVGWIAATVPQEELGTVLRQTNLLAPEYGFRPPNIGCNVIDVSVVAINFSKSQEAIGGLHDFTDAIVKSALRIHKEMPDLPLETCLAEAQRIADIQNISQFTGNEGGTGILPILQLNQPGQRRRNLRTIPPESVEGEER